MTLSCDWCGEEMGGADKGRYGHSLEFKAIDGLGLAGGVSSQDDAPRTKVLGLHFHVVCQRAVSQAVFELVRGHEFEEGELDRWEAAIEQRPPQEVRPDPWQEARNRWDGLPEPERQRQLLEVLQDDRLTNRQIEERLDEVGYKAFDVPMLARRMFKAGELKREQGQWGKARVRYRRNTELTGPIKDLNDVLGEN